MIKVFQSIDNTIYTVNILCTKYYMETIEVSMFSDLRHITHYIILNIYVNCLSLSHQLSVLFCF